MPGGFPVGLEFCNATDQGANLITSGGTTITASATPNTVGAFTQIVASSSIDACWILLSINSVNQLGNAAALNLAVGGGGSEIVIVNNLLDSDEQDAPIGLYCFPCQIPAGTRISAQLQSATASDHVEVSLVLLDGAFTTMEGAAGIDSIGFTAGSTQGTTIDPGGTANTKGVYAQLTSSTSREYMGFLITLDSLNTSPATGNYGFLDIAIGAGGSEKVILPNFAYTNTARTISPQATAPFFIPIPSGTRIAVRAQCTTNVTPSRLFGVTLYGIYK